MNYLLEHTLKCTGCLGKSKEVFIYPTIGRRHKLPVRTSTSSPLQKFHLDKYDILILTAQLQKS